MKKVFLIALCTIAVMFTACKKPVDYSTNFVGSYLGPFTLKITSMNNQTQNWSFPIDSIRMDIVKGSEANTIMATMHIDNETYQASGTATADKADFGTIHLDLDKADFTLNLDLKLECLPVQNDTLNVNGDFTGHGSAMIMGQEQTFNEVSGKANGQLKKQ